MTRGRNSRYIAAAFAVALLGLGASPSPAGPSITNGGETIVDENNPWFLGASPVTFCIQHSAEFSLARAKARESILAALHDWRETLSLLKPKSIDKPLLDGSGKRLSTVYVEESCRTETDLVFYLGVSSPTIAKDLATLAKQTVAFSSRTAYDPNTGRGKGFIWFAPDRGPNAYLNPKKLTDSGGDELGLDGRPIKRPELWSMEAALYNVALHEIGHTLGLKHMPKTIMDSEFPSQVALGWDGLKRTSRELYVTRWGRWPQAPRAVCGLAGHNSLDPRVLGLGPDHPIEKVCFEPPLGDPYVRSRVRIAFYSVANARTPDLTLDFSVAQLHESAISVSGTYVHRFNAPLTGTFHSDHVFFDVADFLQLQGALTRPSGATISAMISISPVYAKPSESSLAAPPVQGNLTISHAGQFQSLSLKSLFEPDH